MELKLTLKIQRNIMENNTLAKQKKLKKEYFYKQYQSSIINNTEPSLLISLFLFSSFYLFFIFNRT